MSDHLALYEYEQECYLSCCITLSYLHDLRVLGHRDYHDYDLQLFVRPRPNHYWLSQYTTGECCCFYCPEIGVRYSKMIHFSWAEICKPEEMLSWLNESLVRYT